MLDEIKSLLPIQEIDSEIYKIDNLLTEIPTKLNNLDAEINRKKEEISAISKEYESLVLSDKEKEIELSKSEETLKSLQAKLFQVKTNKEYSALQDEISNLKQKISSMEDEILTLLDMVEDAKKKKDNAREQIEAEIKKIEEKKQEIVREQKELESKLTELKEKRDELTSGINKELLSIYEKILQHRGGKAICKVGKEGVCTGCYLSLPPQVVNELMIGKKLIYCEGCGCILYYSED